MSDQRSLFDVERTQPAKCIVCGALRGPNETKATCWWEKEQVEFGISARYRPRGCLNYPKPEHDPIPY